MNAQLPPRPVDATLTVTKAARLLGVHPNTVRAWSDAGRLRYYRINPRGDRRYRLGDLQRFLAAAESPIVDAAATSRGARRPFDPVSLDAFRTARMARPTLVRPGLADAQPSEDEERHRRDLALLDAIATGTFAPSTIQDDLRHVADEIRAAGDRD